MSDAQPTEVLPGTYPGPIPPRRRGRGWRVLLWIAIPLVVLVVLFFVADGVVRSIAEDRVASEIEKNLPANVTGDVSVHIGGASVIQQYLSGSFDRVELDAPELMVQDAPLSATIVATGVPSDLTKPVSAVDGTLSISQTSLNKLVSVPGVTGDLTLGKGILSYNGSANLLGLPIGYQVTVKPVAAGKTVLLQPVDAKVTTGGGALDLSKLVAAITQRGPIPVCVAQYLPEGVGVNQIDIVPGHATVHLDAKNMVLDQATLRSKGSC
ncbi:DUF2993 domain-containing protein [Leifsonia sp. NPDC058248]|uniref:LmeA family phospholipid-binding protein n=1 Tax=Leifsonia sp. NPDC058248 TaxID=3346402 RepID=UPI0036DC5502